MAHELQDESGLTTRFEIRVRGELGTDWSDWFAGPVVTAPDGGETVMTGTLDQAALHAVLRRIRDLGLPLISVQRIEPDRTTSDECIDSLEEEA